MINRNIPLPIKRVVRQQCGFGCVICGIPIFDYDHIEEFSSVHSHEVENIALLCPNHHREKTSGRISKKLVQEKRQNPKNKQKNVSASYQLEFSGDGFFFTIGTCNFIISVPNEIPDQFDFPTLVANDQTLISVSLYRDGNIIRWLPTLNITDKAGLPLVKITEGELSLGLTIWDAYLEGTKLTIKDNLSDIRVQLALKNSGIDIKKCEFYVDGKYIRVDDSGVLPEGAQHPMSNMLSQANARGLEIIM